MTRPITLGVAYAAPSEQAGKLDPELALVRRSVVELSPLRYLAVINNGITHRYGYNSSTILGAGAHANGGTSTLGLAQRTATEMYAVSSAR